MKTTRNLLMAGIIMGVFCCSVANAQIIYSNNFALGTGVNISNTPPTLANTYAGGISSARWLDTVGNFAAHNPLLDNCINTSTTPFSYWALPFTPQAGHVYLLAVNLAFTNNPGVAPEFGFHVLYQNNYSGDARFNGSLNGYDFMAPLEGSGNPELFAGAKAINAI